jgi:hypothetical protein
VPAPCALLANLGTRAAGGWRSCFHDSAGPLLGVRGASDPPVAMRIASVMTELDRFVESSAGDAEALGLLRAGVEAVGGRLIAAMQTRATGQVDHVSAGSAGGTLRQSTLRF